MFYNNPLIYINSNIDKENNLVILEQVNNYKFLSENFIKEVETTRKMLKNSDNIEIFCILGNPESINNIEKEIRDKTRKIFKEIQNYDIKTIIENLQKNIEDTYNSITNRFCDIYIKSIVEDKVKFPILKRIENKNGVTCLILYFTKMLSENIESEIDSTMQIFLEREKPAYMGKQIMIQSFLLEDVKNRKILAVLPDIEGKWYALLEGGIKLYLNDENPYRREKVNDKDFNIWTTLSIESMINNPLYAYKKLFIPFELFEEWNSVLLYALASLPIKYEKKTMKLLYEEFLKFIEDNICYYEKVKEAIITKDIFIEGLIANIKNIKKYLEGKEELGISKNLLILLRSRYSYLTNIYKIVEKYYPKQVMEKDNFIHFSNAKWIKLLHKIENAESSYDKGICLEDLVNYFINCIQGLKVTKRRAKTGTEELDLICCNVSENEQLWELGPVILVECKNWANKVDTKVVRSLSYIMDKKGISSLLLFTKNGVTSKAREEIVRQATHNKLILVFNLKELYKINTTKIEPVDLLNFKLEEIQKEVEQKDFELLM